MCRNSRQWLLEQGQPSVSLPGRSSQFPATSPSGILWVAACVWNWRLWLPAWLPKTNMISEEQRHKNTIVKDSCSLKWINELESNSVLFNKKELSIIWYSPSSHRSRGGLQIAEWRGFLICPTNCCLWVHAHSVHREWQSTYYTAVP